MTSSAEKYETNEGSVPFHLDHTVMAYRYRQIAGHLAARITSGELAMNRPLPAEVRLARQYGVSLGTMRRATEILRNEGLVVTLRSKGTFVIRTASEEEVRQIAGGDRTKSR